jgi:hypothetical protein
MSGNITLGHFFILMAFVDLIVMWKVTSRMRLDDDRLPDEKRRPAGLIMAAALIASGGLVAFALLHPLGKMPIL